jgi:hypothetical protein
LQFEDHGPREPFRLLRAWPIDETLVQEPGKRLAMRGPDDESQSAFAYTNATGSACVRWQTAVSVTRPPTDARYANPSRPHGIGCLRAAASADDLTADAISLCRTSDDAEYAVVTLASHLAGADDVTTLRSPMQQADGPGEMLRLDVCPDATGTAVDAYTAGAFGSDGTPHWVPVGHVHSTAALTYQGLSATRDVLFIDARHDGHALSSFDVTGPVALHAPGTTASAGAAFDDLSYPPPTSDCHDPLYPIGCNAP